LKFVFSNDEFYDPLLYYTGWNPVTRLQNGIMVWEKPDIEPMPVIQHKRDIPKYQVFMWGIIPISALCISLMLVALLAMRENLLSGTQKPIVVLSDKKRTDAISVKTMWVVRLIPLLTGISVLVFSISAIQKSRAALSPSQVVSNYYEHLDFRRHKKAYDLLDTNSANTFDEFLTEQRVTGGLIPSYGKLQTVDVVVDLEEYQADRVTAVAELRYLTAIGIRRVTDTVDLGKNVKGEWKIIPKPFNKTMSEKSILRTQQPAFRDFNSTTIGVPIEAGVRELSRPAVTVNQAKLVTTGGRFYVVGRVENNTASPVKPCLKRQSQCRSK